MANVQDVFQQFVAAINRHDVPALAALLAADHALIDSLGNRVTGARSTDAGWRGYFAMCPDYWIRVEHALDEREIVLAVGEAGGMIDGQTWPTPAAWKAVIRDGHVVEWRVFADNKPVYEILAGRQR